MAGVLGKLGRAFKTYRVITNCVFYGGVAMTSKAAQQAVLLSRNERKAPRLVVKEIARAGVMGSGLAASTLYYWNKWLNMKTVGTTTTRRAVTDKCSLDPMIINSFNGIITGIVTAVLVVSGTVITFVFGMLGTVMAVAVGFMETPLAVVVTVVTSVIVVAVITFRIGLADFDADVPPSSPRSMPSQNKYDREWEVEREWEREREWDLEWAREWQMEREWDLEWAREWQMEREWELEWAREWEMEREWEWEREWERE